MRLVPLSYNLRSLLVRWPSTVLTVASVAATVAVLAGMLSLQQGFATTFAEQGREDLVVFLRPGATSEGESAFQRERADLLVKETPEIAEDAAGRPLAAAEVYLAIRRFKADGGETNVSIRGVQPASFAMRPEVRIAEGRPFAFGSDEIIVGRALVARLRDAAVGDVMHLNTTPFTVVGVLDGPGAFESEIWGDVDRLRDALERPLYNRVVGQLRPDADVAALAARLEEDVRVPANVLTERAYLEGQTVGMSVLFVTLGTFLAAVMGVGAVFTGTNSLLSAVAARTHEIGILLSVGFRPLAVFASFMVEAAALGALGGLAGCLVVLPLSGISTGTMNFQTFTEFAFAFRVTPLVLGVAVAFAMALGLIGGLVPAWRAARMPVVEALRRG